MRIPRIYHPEALANQTNAVLSEEATNHVARVLRMKSGDMLELFDGSNYVFSAVISDINKKKTTVTLQESRLSNLESPLELHLGQVISRGEKMEFTIQKSVELGIKSITPLLSERCGVKLEEERLSKKVQQWQKIAIAACEQCGRNSIPEIHPVITLAEWCAKPHDNNALKLNLHPRATHSINSLVLNEKQILLLIGPEGGLSDDEIAMTAAHGFTDILLGPRVLRTETAALAVITALQTRFGDLG